MSTARIRNLSLALGVVFLAVVAMTVNAFSAGGDSRELTLYARDMAFYLPGEAIPNPTLRVTAGEEIRLTLVNEEAGVRHDLAIEGLGFAIAPLDLRPGSRGSATLRVPARPGRYPYVCTFHLQMMRGVLVVEPGRG